AAVVPLECETGKLRIDDDEVLRKSSVAQQSAIHSGERGGGVDEICETANVTISKKRIRRRKTAQCHRSRKDPAVHHGGAHNTRRGCCRTATGARDIESLEQPVEELRIAAGPGPAITSDIERV